MTTKSNVSTTDNTPNDSTTTNKKWSNLFYAVLGACIDYGCYALVIWVIVATMHN